MDRLSKFPFFIILMGIAAISMYPAAVVGVQTDNFQTARAFFYSGSLLLIFCAMMAIILRGFRPMNIGRSHLITLVGAYVALPVLFAFPLLQALPDTAFFPAYFEMVSSFTTTGASTYDVGRLNEALHLWRAEVAWLGGLFVWITAAAVLAPLNLGGYEISATAEPGRGVGGTSSLLPNLDTSTRLIRITTELVPVYVGLTAALWVSFIIAGDDPLEGLVYALSTLSTSGITLDKAGVPVSGGLSIEILIVFFLVFALSRRAFSTDSAMKTTARLIDDPEMRVGALLVCVTTAVLFLRHFVGAVEVGAEGEAAQAVQAFWGSFFTVISFLTTTGFVSEFWVDAQGWSGLATPGFALLGIAMVGGGVATTAGGIKLLRVFALFVHGRRELRRLVHPSVATGKGQAGREVPMRGVYIAWLFFMLFGLSIALIWVALAINGVPFEEAMLLTVSTISTTGPLASVVSDGAVTYSDQSNGTKGILVAAMILGRLETLALITLLNREFWHS